MCITRHDILRSNVNIYPSITIKSYPYQKPCIQCFNGKQDCDVIILSSLHFVEYFLTVIIIDGILLGDYEKRDQNEMKKRSNETKSI